MMQFIKMTVHPPVHTRIVGSWFEQHEDSLQHLPQPAQSPDILELLWSVLESEVRSRFPLHHLPSNYKMFLNEVLCNIPLADCSQLISVYSEKDTSCITG
jgi:hypothetical protein